MPNAALQALSDKASIPIAELEALWKKAEKATKDQDYDDDKKYAVIMAVFKKMVKAEYGAQALRKAGWTSEGLEKVKMFFECTGDAPYTMARLLAHISDTTRSGAGTEIEVSTGDGKEQFYLDGDGADHIYFDPDQKESLEEAENLGPVPNKPLGVIMCGSCGHNAKPMGKVCSNCGNQIVR